MNILSALVNGLKLLYKVPRTAKVRIIRSEEAGGGTGGGGALFSFPLTLLLN